MVSHVDDDHIKGILDLTKEQRAEPDVRLEVAVSGTTASTIC